MPAVPADVPHEIRTERLILRSGRAGDGPALHQALAVSLPDFFPWLSFSAQLADVATLERVSMQAQLKFVAGEFYVWRAWDPDGQTLVATVDLHSIDRSVPRCEIGYWLRSDRTGHGLAQEAVSAVIDVAWEHLRALRIEARCDVRNERSWRFAEGLGFAFEGIARNDDRDAAGALCSSKVYALTHTEDVAPD
jgi:ribosomal-protein-serine acetyltransferase